MKWTLRRIAPLALLVAACAGPERNQDQPTTDEAHRPADWAARLNLVMSENSDAAGYLQADVVEHSTTQPFDGLVSQLWKMAFSGDIAVYAPTVLGDVDYDHPLNPKELHDYLQATETITVENVETGELRDTTIDVSFTEQSVSALVVYMGVEKDNGISTRSVVMGKQMFDENTGDYRGVLGKFFLSFEGHAQIGYECSIVIESDSNGIFRPTRLEAYDAVEQVKYFLAPHQGADSLIRLDLDMECSFSEKYFSVQLVD